VSPSIKDVAAFDRDGHVLIRGLCPREEIARHRRVIGDGVAAVTARGDTQNRIDDYSRLFTQVTNIWRLSDAAREIVFNGQFAAAAAALLGVPAVRLYHDQALFKPGRAARTPWHQDRYYWPLETDRTVTMWLALVDIDETMGLMKFASGSHRHSAGLGELVISNDTDERLKSVIEERRWPVASTPPMKAGDATFHSGATIHSAGANDSDRVREVLTVIYYASGTRVSVPANENQRTDLAVFLPGVKPGEEAASELNPVLYP
jgi:ectoine hydroxylase-related dioxygenase (phytanoyl-CoA dioxygenase family)